ncbi:IPExxxVDY family protein [Salegentibacter salarius]|uniref:IPExxxVDY family protein n=1 Tax=Salegentibacter salarius TaxID=435906 RepID=A0A2N0TV61_9FLAO|nr:IPExxxVDY family protein [Salegentibacter salarius]OEY72308.1 hypothetical protein BHS39_02485 [Salegentibacter salarius]PKD18630.1 hypothetical protein APR40_02485 [Salegentibacter salarius]SLJ87663.1 hypothetical protein SAMN05660445_00505 [Salegentibacter salarius]
MQLHKTLLEDVEEDEFGLIALYGDLEEYKMAYLLNKYLKLQLKRERRDLDFNHKSVKAYYAHYSFKDLKNFRSYHLVANKFKGESKKILSAGSLFEEEEVRPLQVNLVPEYKKVDFFLKIDEELNQKDLNLLVNAISQIPQVRAVYKIDTDLLKSKQNLIFE